MEKAAALLLQLIAALGALGVFWQLFTHHRAHRDTRLSLLRVTCHGDSDGLIVMTAWDGHSAAEGFEIEARVLAPRNAIVAIHEAEQETAPTRRATGKLWRPFYSRGGLRMGDEVMTRFRVTAPQKLTRIRLQLRLKSTATKRTILTLTRWFSPAS